MGPDLRQRLDTPDTSAAVATSPTMFNYSPISLKKDLVEPIKEGSLYEIDHSKLPTDTPESLRSARVVWVTAISGLNVTVMYPNTRSLAACHDNAQGVDFSYLGYEKYELGSNFTQIFRRRIPVDEFKEHMHLKYFWLIYSSTIEQPIVTNEYKIKHGTNYSGLQDREIQTWISKKRMTCGPNGGLDEGKSLKYNDFKACKQKEECHKTDKGKELVIDQYTRHHNKRGRPPFSQSNKSKHAFKKRATEAKSESGENNDNNKKCSNERWPKRRYDEATIMLAQILRENKGYHDNPMPRKDLRREAKKRIGDTGLLDHLLKHLANQVIPLDNMERLRRRCDAEGMMEYWLESADLVDIRKKAGVVDPFWVPPPGWKLGDAVAVYDCHYLNEIKVLNKKLSSMKSEMEELKKANDKVKQPNIKITLDNTQSSGSVRTNNMSKKEIIEALMKKKVRLQEQLERISLYLLDVELNMDSDSDEDEAVEMSEDMKEALATYESIITTNKSGEIEITDEARESGSSTLKIKPCSPLDDHKDNTWLSEMDQLGSEDYHLLLAYLPQL